MFGRVTVRHMLVNWLINELFMRICVYFLIKNLYQGQPQIRQILKDLLEL